jgi:hypothetical protein
MQPHGYFSPLSLIEEVVAVGISVLIDGQRSIARGEFVPAQADKRSGRKST